MIIAHLTGSHLARGRDSSIGTDQLRELTSQHVGIRGKTQRSMHVRNIVETLAALVKGLSVDDAVIPVPVL